MEKTGWIDFEEEVSLVVDSDLLSYCCRFYSADTVQITKYRHSCLIFHLFISNYIVFGKTSKVHTVNS
jgi:hypothetical protein